MQSAKRLDRPNITDAIADSVRELIVDGRLEAGSRVNEVHLAAALGVSRTPLREALMHLKAEGALTASPRLGFFVAPLSREELDQIYPIRQLLDPEALRLSGKPSPERLTRLRSINEQLRKATKPANVIAIDDAFHFELIDGCPNRVLVALIEQFARRTRRYEMALMRAHANVRSTAKDHDVILARLRRGDMRGACAALRQNMKSGAAPIREWLSEREERR